MSRDKKKGHREMPTLKLKFFATARPVPLPYSPTCAHLPGRALGGRPGTSPQLRRLLLATVSRLRM